MNIATTYSATVYDRWGRAIGDRRLSDREAIRVEELRQRAEARAADPLDPATDPDPGGVWHVCCTEPQQESRATAGMVGRGLVAYVPGFTRRIRQGFNRRAASWRPMFPGYVFCRFDPKGARWPTLLKVPGVRGLLVDSGEHAATLSEGEVAVIKATEAKLARDRNVVLPFKPGDRVEVEHPLLVDRLAVIEQMDDRLRATVIADLFGGTVRITTSIDRIRKA